MERIYKKLIRFYIEVSHKLRFKRPYANSANVFRLRNKILEIELNYPLKESLWDKNRAQLRSDILRKNPNDFINWDVIQNTMFYEAPEIEYINIACKKSILEGVKENKVGYPKPYYLNLKTSGNLVHHAYSLHQISDFLNHQSIDSIVEFGGGYGSMCRLLRNLDYFGRYTIFDLPEFLALQEFYLRSVDKKYINNTFFKNKLTDLKKIKKYDLLIATWSLSECSLELRNEFLTSIDCDCYLIAFQSEFEGINNMEYFKDFVNSMKSHQMKILAIDHLPNNYYLIGSRGK